MPSRPDRQERTRTGARKIPASTIMLVVLASALLLAVVSAALLTHRHYSGEDETISRAAPDLPVAEKGLEGGLPARPAPAGDVDADRVPSAGGGSKSRVDDLPAQVEEWRSRAAGMARSGDIQGAIEELYRAISISPEEPVLQREMSHLVALMGWKSLEQGDLRKALGFFEESLFYWPDNIEALRGMGFARYSNKDVDGAEKSLLSYLEKGGDRPDVYALLGEILYSENRLEDAHYFFQLSLLIDPEQPALAEKARRVQREAKIEGDFDRSRTRHFIFKHEGESLPEVLQIVEVICEEAYLQVGLILGVYPASSITVILYTDRQFQDVTRSPAWAGAIFDGKIRIPAKGLAQRSEVVERIIRHEYTHAVVHDHTGGRAPVWLQEGLAQKVEGFAYDPSFVAEKLIQGGGPFPLKSLEGNFISLTRDRADLAYMESRLAIQYLEEVHGPFALRELLDWMGKGHDVAGAIREVTGLGYGDFDRRFGQWVRELAR